MAALVGLIASALLFDFTNGFHDSANAIATVGEVDRMVSTNGLIGLAGRRA
jgi:phosphate/sulfate permease